MSLPMEKIYLCVCLPVMASHCAMKRPRAGDVIHPVLWLEKGRAIARLDVCVW